MFWMEILEHYSIDFRNIAELILILLSIPFRNWLTQKKLFENYEIVLQVSVSNFCWDLWDIIPSIQEETPEQLRISLDDLSQFDIWNLPCINIFRIATFCFFVW